MRRGRPAGKKDPDEYRRDTTNPYEKVLYKKRRSYHDDPKEGNEGNRSPGKWESEEDKDDENYIAQDDRSDFPSEKVLRVQE